MIQRFVLGFLTCFLANLCFAGDAHDLQLGGCGFTGPDVLTEDYYCNNNYGNASKSGIKKEAAKKLLTMAWHWVTGKKADNAAYATPNHYNLNEGQKFDPTFRLKARRDNLYLTVAYEF